jgi:phosphatidylethanolamine/phosphatidyl-N-methylethanolamine N-methyltransferase
MAHSPSRLLRDGAVGRRGRLFGDNTRFLKTLMESPRLTGAVAPSGRFLARAMARPVDANGKGLVIELGPGTGPVTRALIEHGVAPERLVLVEYDDGFCRLLSQRYASIRVVRGDAYDLPRTLAAFADEPVAAVVSSLPLLNQPPALRAKMIDDAFALMGADGLLVQFTYGLVSPIAREVCAGRFSAHCTAPIWRNLPPARVWTYRADPHGAFIEPLIARVHRRAERLVRAAHRSAKR